MSAGRWPWAIVGLALGLRLLLLLSGSAEPQRLRHEPDSSGYERLALNLLAHGRFSQDDRPPFRPDHTRTPLYPALLAALYGVSGPRPTAAALVNILAGVGTIAAIVFTGARLADPTPALVAGGILAVDPTSAAYSSLLLTEPLFTLLLTLALTSLLLALGTGRACFFAVSGVWLGLASVTRPIGLYLPLLLAGALGWRPTRPWTRTIGAVATLLVAVALLTTPWALRNRLTGGGFALSSIGVINLYYHRAGAVLADATGTSREEARHELADRLERAVSAEGLSEAAAYRVMTTWARQIIGSDPWRYLRLHVVGVGRMLGPDPDPLFRLLGWLGPDGRPLAHRTGYWWGAVALEAAFLGGLYGAALAGVGRASRQGQSWLLLPALLTIGYAGVLGGPEVYPRFRVPLMPCFAWLAGLGLAPLADRFRR